MAPSSSRVERFSSVFEQEATPIISRISSESIKSNVSGIFLSHLNKPFLWGAKNIARIIWNRSARKKKKRPGNNNKNRNGNRSIVSSPPPVKQSLPTFLEFPSLSFFVDCFLRQKSVYSTCVTLYMSVRKVIRLSSPLWLDSERQPKKKKKTYTRIVRTFAQRETGRRRVKL